MSQKIICPNCNHEFFLEDRIREELEKEMAKKLSVAEEEKKKLVEQAKKEKEELQKQKEEVEKNLKEVFNKKWLELEKKKNEEIELEKEKTALEAKNKVELELNDLKNKSLEQEKIINESRDKELEFRKKIREVELKEKNIELEVQKKLDDEKQKMEENIAKDIMEKERLKMLEKDKQMEIMKKTIENLQRQSEQGSMQIQGEVLENDIKRILSERFAWDKIYDVKTGQRGADIVQEVHQSFGRSSGIILWEIKNTKNWNQEWIKKLKEDQINSKADICVLVTSTMPDGIDDFASIEGVWICNIQSFLSLAEVLRLNLVEISYLKSSMEGKDEKMNILYNYLISNDFKNRIQKMLETFQSMKSDLEREKASFFRIWSKREKDIEALVFNSQGFYGDLQSIIGNKMETLPYNDLDTIAE